MIILHDPSDPLLNETLRYLAQYALESPLINMRVQVGKITMTCVANTLKTQSVTFGKPFKSVPFLIISKNPAITSSVVTESYSALTVTGFTAQLYTSSNQNVDYTYLAIGQI